MFVIAKQPFVSCIEFQRNVDQVRNNFIDKFNDNGISESVIFQYNRQMKMFFYGSKSEASTNSEIHRTFNEK